MFFILVRAYGFSYQDVLSALTSDNRVNDRFVCKFINKFFKLRTVVKDKIARKEIVTVISPRVEVSNFRHGEAH